MKPNGKDSKVEKYWTCEYCMRWNKEEDWYCYNCRNRRF